MTHKPDPLLPDWSSFLTRANKHLALAEQAFMVRDWDSAVNSMSEARKNLDGIAGWLLKREIVEGR